MKRILLTLSVLFIIIISVKSQSFTIEKRDCNITFVSTTTSRVWYSYDLYQAVINYDPALDVQKFIIGDNLRTNTYSKFQITNFSTIPIIIDSFYSWKTQCIDLHKGSASIDTASNSWKLIGNDISSTDFLGTNNSQPLVLKTNGTEKARITTAGKVGININTPTSTLDINGDLRIRGLITSTTYSVLGIDDSGYIYKVAGGGNSLKLYSENYDSATFAPNTTTGLNAVSIGIQNTASGDRSIAMGSNATASNNEAFAIGVDVEANGSGSFAFGNSSYANGGGSFAFGQSVQSNSFVSVAMGISTTANGEASTAMGNATSANGDYSTSFGYQTTANGQGSTSFGANTESYSLIETSFGSKNTSYTPISTTSFEPNDRLLVVGNGNEVQSDAFTILKNAKTGIDIDSFEQTNSLAKLQVNGLISTNIQTTNVTNLDLTDANITQTILVDNTYNSVDITLPNPAICYYNSMSIRLTIKQITNNKSNVIRIIGFGSETIDGESTYSFKAAYESIDLVTDGTNWWIVSNNN